RRRPRYPAAWLAPLHRGSALAHPAQPSLVAYRGTSHRSDDEHTVCQALVSLTLARGEVPVCVGLRLFLPELWAGDAERRRRAGVPDDVAGPPKGRLAPAG